MIGVKYNAQFWKTEIANLSLWLTQPVSPEYRVTLQHQLASARAHLADLENTSQEFRRVQAASQLVGGLAENYHLYDPADNGNQGS